MNMQFRKPALPQSNRQPEPESIARQSHRQTSFLATASATRASESSSRRRTEPVSLQILPFTASDASLSNLAT